jgi:hypothetical protein
MPNILDSSAGSAISLLNAAKSFARGIGLSANARALNEGFFESSKTGFNNLFGLAAGPSLTIEGLQTQIKGLRASLPQSRISPSLIEDNGAAGPSENGRNVNTQI